MLSRSSSAAAAAAATGRFKKRERTQNWAFEEKQYLLELCKRDINIIENKRLDADLTALKNRAWKVVHEDFCKVFGNERNCNRLKEQWRRMKASTRSEILDYTRRLSKYGQEVADQKRPSAFTFEVWEFMQSAKSCKSDRVPLAGNQSKIDATMDNDAVDGQQLKKNDEEMQELSDNDEADLFNWQKTSHSMCEVEIKDESSSDVRTNSQSPQLDEQTTNKESTNRKRKIDLNSVHENISYNYDGCTLPSSINPMTASLDVLNMLRNHALHASTHNSCNKTNDNNNWSDEVQVIVEMQAKEHAMRMDILRVQLETAKFNRDIAEINKILLLRSIQNANGKTDM